MIREIHGSEEYDNIEVIAAGGMGTVLKARKKGVEGFEKTVAIKMLLESLSNDEKFVQDFIAEAKCVANLIHENIVQIYQLNKCRFGYYFVMEYVDGISLFDFMEFHRKFGVRLPQNLAVFIAARVARGLAYAHSRRDSDGTPLRIVHCDVCTHNIMINSEGVPKLTDFGIARVATRKFDGKVSGKLAYMSPEQARKEEMDFRSDIYSLGMVLFYLLTGETARDCSGELTAILENAQANNLRWELLEKNGVPGDLAEILRKMLADRAEDRFSDTSELARSLEYYIYKDGYGPTIVTLANYMRELLPARFGGPATEIGEIDRTVVM